MIYFQYYWPDPHSNRMRGTWSWKLYSHRQLSAWNSYLKSGEKSTTLTSNVYFSLLLKSINIVIWKVETCNMCFRVFKPVTCAPPTPTSEPSSYFKIAKLLLDYFPLQNILPWQEWSYIYWADQSTQPIEQHSPGGIHRIVSPVSAPEPQGGWGWRQLRRPHGAAPAQPSLLSRMFNAVSTPQHCVHSLEHLQGWRLHHFSSPCSTTCPPSCFLTLIFKITKIFILR